MLKKIQVFCVAVVALVCCGFVDSPHNVVGPTMEPKAEAMKLGTYLLGGWLGKTTNGKTVPTPYEVSFNEDTKFYEFKRRVSDMVVPQFGLRLFKLEGLPSNVYLMQVLFTRLDDRPAKYSYGYLRVEKNTIDGFLPSGYVSDENMKPEVQGMIDPETHGFKNTPENLLPFMKSRWWMTGEGMGMTRIPGTYRPD